MKSVIAITLKNTFRFSLFLFIIVSISSCKFKKDMDTEEVLPDPEIEHTYEFGICVDSLDITRYTIKSGEYLSGIFMKLGFSAAKADSISRAVAPILNPARIRAGNPYTTFTTGDSIAIVQYIIFEKTLTDHVIIDLSTNSIKTYEFLKDIALKPEYTEGVITSSLWNTIVDTGANPLLALELSDVFAWQVDFFEVRPGDSFRVMYSSAYIDDTTFINIASIDAAVFTHMGREYNAVPFEQDSVREFFDEEGNSLRKAFLKAPLDFFRITSRFSNSRYHPVLKHYRAHHGVDYAAPTGTPVKTIGDGTVIAKGYQSGGGGNYLKIKHNSTYTTTYMHLSRFASGIQQGTRVRQGDVIGYVGSTGLSTGPHLDFRVHKNNTPINPLKMEAPPSLPVKPELKDSFMVVYQEIMQRMDSLHVLLSF